MSKVSSSLVVYLVIGLVIGAGIGYAIPTLLLPQTTPPVVDLLDTITQRGYMVIGTSSGWPPFEMVNTTTNELYGFDIDLCNYIANELNVTIQWSDLDFDALVGACSAGTIDLIAAATFITAERNAVLAPSVWYIRTNEVVVVKASSPLTITHLENLTGLDVGVQTGTVEDDEITQLIDDGVGIIIHRYPRPDTMFADLDAGTLDAVYVDEPVFDVYASTYSVKVIFTVTAPPTALYMRYGNLKFQKAVNNAIVKAFETGALDAMIAKWFG
ncbi:MAG: amino acid ABC transporter substrate-binding protein [Candidatus Thorarchaeota archaeon]|nr:amino acid ABC transporter substrate-binding protein [Candidatus Thorarchaeota archaeon]